MEPEQPSTKDVPQRPQRRDKQRLPRRKRFLFIAGVVLVVVCLLVGWYKISSSTSVVPKKIQKSVDFSVYYPGSLPLGYTLDPTSFQLADPEVVLFTVTYGKSKNIVFSEERQPSSGEIDKFISSYIPLNSVVQLPLGQAKIGAYGSAPNIRTVLSLPIHNGPWLIVTAPSDVNHDDLVKIVTSLTK